MFNELIFNILNDIQDSIEIILQRTKEINTAEDFLENDYNLTIYDSVVMRLQVIGELIKSIQNKDQNFLKQYNQIDWNEIIRMRDKISHHYLDLDVEIVFNICKENIPELKNVVSIILNDFKM